jgi:hypothetical protein
MGAPHVTPDQKKTFVKALREGYNIKDASQEAEFSYVTGRRLAALLKLTPHELRSRPTPAPETGPKHPHELSQPAERALSDFGYFRARYFGRISSPWQEDAAERVVKLLNTPFKEYVVINCPPGSGKSTLFTHDIPAWLTVRSRTHRGLIGSSTQTLANLYTGRLRNTLERRIPMVAKPEELAHGFARDADATLVGDYGIFKPTTNAPWTKSQFTVEQFYETSVDEKESTWTAFGADTKFLGWRGPFIVWDDLVTKDSVRTLEAIEAQRMWWLDEAQTRIEPGGLLVLQGQRLHAEDLYRFCLNMEVSFDELDEHLIDLGEQPTETRKKYTHVVYKAHDDVNCQAALDPSVHKRTAPAYGAGGCLLDPVRLPWYELKTIMDQPLTNYRVVYQQEDVDPDEVLVQKVWIDGGQDHKGNYHPGCYDKDRAIAQIPQGLVGTKLSIISVDPSPTKFWSIQWWLYVQPPEVDHLMGTRYLLDMYRAPMDAPDLLDWSTSLGTWTGLLVDWQERAKILHQPIQFLIVEKNAAQRFLLQYEWFRRWVGMHNITVRPHSTQTNKSDQEFGVKTIKNHYRYGRVRFPGTHEGRQMVKPLVTELTRYPDSTTDDCVMANWFMEFQLQFLVDVTQGMPAVYNDIPGWMSGRREIVLPNGVPDVERLAR